MKILILVFKFHLKFIYFFIKLIPINKNKIVFLSRQSNSASLDFRLLENELLSINPNLKTVFLCKKFSNTKKDMISYYLHIYKQMYHIATSRVCIIDSYIIPISILNHKKALKVIQIWHAMGAIKKFGYQSITKQAGNKKNQVLGIKTSNIDKLMCMHKNYDVIISGSKEMVKYFSKAFDAELNQFMIQSLPRIDYLINEKESIIKNIYEKYPELKNKKTILYAPTFRKDKNKIDELIKSVNFKKYNLIIKGHPNKNIDINKSDIYVCDDFSALELLTIADYLITDYSAISIEASVLNIPIYFYLYDYKDYIKYNGVNIDLYKEMPGACFKNIEEILADMDKNKYNLDIVNNFKNKYVANYNGDATKNISKYIIDNCLYDITFTMRLKNIFKDSENLRKLYRSLRYVKGSFDYSKYYRKNKVNDKQVFFEAYMGKSYACSPKALYEEMLSNKEYYDYKFIWCFTNPDTKKDLFNNDRTILVERNSSDYYKALASSKYWIVNSIVPEHVKKKKNQIYVQTWHGTPLKRLRYDITATGSKTNSASEIRKRNDIDVRKIDYFISPSKFATDKFTSAFNLKKLNKENIIIEKGYPRNESLFRNIDKDKLKEELNIPKDKKIIFYAPTFRDDSYNVNIGYTYNINLDFDNLKNEIGEDHIVLFRPHYFVANGFDFDKYKGFVYDVTNVDDINDLYIVSDLLITDYSSVFFDFANTKKPMIFYMYDLENYEDNLRGFYMDLKELPGPIVKDEKELINQIKNIDVKKYKNKYKKFNDKFNYLDNEFVSRKMLKDIISKV